MKINDQTELIKQVLFFFGTLLLTTSCIRTGYDDSCPSVLQVIYNWDNVKPLLDTDSLLIVSKEGKVRCLKTSSTGAELDLPDGEYCMTAYEANPEVKISSGVVTAHQTDGVLNNLTPFSAGVGNFVVQAKAMVMQRLEIVMYRQTRPLQVKVHFIGAGIDFLRGVSGELEGITLSRSVEQGFPPIDGKPLHKALANGRAGLSFTRVSAPAAKESSLQQDFQTERRLLGIDGAATQYLNLEMDLASTTRRQAQHLQLNLSDGETYNVLKFHIDHVEEPYVIELTIRLGADFTADIVDWKTGSESELEAH